MTQRCSVLFPLPGNLYSEGSPVVIQSGGLMRDDNSGWLFAQLNLQNITDLPIKMAKVEITCFDSVGRVLINPFIFEYLDMVAGRGQLFGMQTAINIPVPSTRSILVKVVEVGFVDNRIWTYRGAPWKRLPSPVPIESCISDSDALNGYRSAFGESAKYHACRYQNLWICACGSINHAYEDHCFSCNADQNKLFSIDEETLKAESKYAEALKLSEGNTLPSAVRSQKIFEELGDYKDSREKAEACKVKADQTRAEFNKKESRRKKALIISISLIVTIALLAVVGYFVAYPYVCYTQGDYSVYINMYDVKEFTIPEGVTEIKDEAFLQCNNLEMVNIPSSVTSIGHAAFAHCYSIEYLFIPNGVTYIGTDAFAFTNMVTITLPSGITTISDGLFYYGDSVSVFIPEGVTSIGARAFKECSELTSIELPDTVTTIGREAFAHSEIEEITIPEGIRVIADDAFDYCDKLYTIHYGGTMEQWNKLNVDVNYGATIYCSDGRIVK